MTPPAAERKNALRPPAAGTYSYTSLANANNCATFASDALQTAGVATLPVATPLGNLATTTLQSPEFVSQIAGAGATVNASRAAMDVTSSQASSSAASSSSTQASE
jgi:hypothetical protein